MRIELRFSCAVRVWARLKTRAQMVLELAYEDRVEMLYRRSGIFFQLQRCYTSKFDFVFNIHDSVLVAGTACVTARRCRHGLQTSVRVYAAWIKLVKTLDIFFGTNIALLKGLFRRVAPDSRCLNNREAI